MFGSIGVPELLIILAIALLIFGPKKLPEVGRSIGKALREFRKTSDEIKGKIEDEIQAEEFKEIQRDIDNIGKSEPRKDPYQNLDNKDPEPPLQDEDYIPPKDKESKQNNKQEIKRDEEGK
ncbi:MAG: twin-arginine translocase subunit TatB [Candidatus Aminicenantes bacterium]|nr:twin-arginine translocase subunit TatB [Candidatus Aminicenantes bacterium]